jgi:hypothetical protein
VPSFRVIVGVGLIRPGVRPDAVVPAIADAVAERTVVEASSLDVVSGEARVTVRFTADGVDDAIPIAEHAVARLREIAETGAWRLTERVGGRWFRRA